MNFRLLLFPAAMMLLLALSGCGQIAYPDEEIAAARSKSSAAQSDDADEASSQKDSKVASAKTLDEEGTKGAEASEDDTEAGVGRAGAESSGSGASRAKDAAAEPKALKDRARSHASQPKRVQPPRPVASATEATLPTVVPTDPPAPTADPMANTGPPSRVEIPAIGVDALVERVGLTADRAMDVPKGWMNVGWYENGFYPGEVGNSVIAGHLDTSTGGPAVFWDLNQLVPGDEVIVTYEDGSRLTFSVVDNRIYDHDAQGAIIESIFGKSLTPDLNLVTCDGAWDHGLATYAKRLVVFTTLLPEKSVFAGAGTDLID